MNTDALRGKTCLCTCPPCKQCCLDGMMHVCHPHSMVEESNRVTATVPRQKKKKSQSSSLDPVDLTLPLSPSLPLSSFFHLAKRSRTPRVTEVSIAIRYPLIRRSSGLPEWPFKLVHRSAKRADAEAHGRRLLRSQTETQRHGT